MGGELVTLAVLAVVLVVAVLRPHGLPEAPVAVVGALLVLAAGLVSREAALEEIEQLVPVLVFLAAILVLAQMCAAEGLFTAAGLWLARSSGRSPHRLLIHVFALCAGVTCVLSLDATAVLLTPVVAATAIRMRVRPEPHVYATGHLANSASLLLPMGNLTNLLALTASGLTLAAFAGLMLLPWLCVLLVEYVAFRLFFRSDLKQPGIVDITDSVDVPTLAVGVLVLTLLGVVGTSMVGFEPFWAAVAGALVLSVHALARRRVAVRSVVAAMDLPFLAFVVGLAVVVRSVVDEGFGPWVDDRLPSDDALGSLLVLAMTAALLANLVNNLPALLIVLPLVADVGPVAVLAVLIGVNVGPNLAYTGSLATLLWRRVATSSGVPPSLGRFTLLGLATVPLGVATAVVALWASARALPFS